MALTRQRTAKARTAAARRWLAAALVLTGGAILTACGGTAHSRAISVVASTDVWGSVARAVAGPHVAVKSILSGADIDPHSYEVSPADAAAIADAALVVFNGGGYDGWVDGVLARHPDAKQVDAYSFLDGGQPRNEHVFYDLTVAKSVAATIADRLATLDPANAADYRANAAAFGREADSIAGAEHAIATTHPNTAVVATEPVAFYLLQASGLANRTPPTFEAAIENETDPAPADMAVVLDLVNRRQVAAVLINPQTSTTAVNGLRDAARHAGVPVTDVSETLTDGTDYLTWQRNTVNQLQTALQSSGPAPS
ncbi:ABC transporter substrate-binding protein [Mycobacterium colombiense]|uniref:ABC transporter substrate-binding protein n=1 Tax=Mycobacterium colombiense TaxID=339268 RepID=A0A853M4T1_9MYCO|nr:zinc ABC transporter substrate-binding protein [Mycobacterium colombiense]OBJ13862.1 ABC transporter substrate-binding protein [Mycobacterium colombiense]OBJ63642.1 ABC transporter substrate-binding protein [Mycobacterium colombiense]OBK61525.1 ABC transporter substrate-binding protein [Mycobacterium colombiense]